MESIVNKELVFSYFAGNCSAFQKKLIANWALEKSNEELFFQWLCEWERQNVQYPVDIEAGISRHLAWKESLSNAQKPMVSSFPSYSLGSMFWRKSGAVACAVIGILFFGWLFQDYLLYTTHTTSYGEIRNITLPDESKVTLNANSQLIIPRFTFWQDQRKVHVRGEANFEVVHTIDHRRFVVKTDDNLEVEVLGTEFNVYSRPSGNRVVLKRGKILLNYTVNQQQKTIEMKPGQLAELNSKGEVQLNQNVDVQQHTDWQYHRFVFEDLTFRQVGERLNDVFGSRIQFEEEELANQLISGSFRALDAGELLELLAESGNFQYRKEGNDFVIRQLKK